MIEVGKVVNTFGIKGELKVLPFMENFNEIKRVSINEEEFEIEKVRFQKGVAIVKLKGFDDINLVEKYKGKIIKINDEDAPDLPKGTYYIKDLLGMEVITDDGKILGNLDNVITTTANDVYEVGKILLPATKEVIKKIDLEKRQITVHIIKGLI